MTSFAMILAFALIFFGISWYLIMGDIAYALMVVPVAIFSIIVFDASIKYKVRS